MARFRGWILLLVLGVLALPLAAQGVRAVVVNEFANIRLIPAIGAEVLGSVPAGFVFENINGRSADGEWLRVVYFGQEGWVNITPLRVLDGDVGALPVADPRSIPYGGFEAPRAGVSSQQGPIAARAINNVRIRNGPSRAYPTIGNIFTNQGMTLTGRTESNAWVQVNFEGTLGWVSSRFVEILNGDINSLPIDGIVASGPAIIGTGVDEFVQVLRLLLDRINLAQPSLDTIRAYWADAALTGRAACRPYPAQPSDVQISTPTLAANFTILEPLRVDFNDSMANLRLAIRLFIEVCNQPGTGNPVGQATVEGALNIVNTVQAQFDSLRSRITALLPPENDGTRCQLDFNRRRELLPIINKGQIYLDALSPRNYATGFCFDGVEGEQILIQTLPLPRSNVELFVAVSPLDAPTNFVALQRIGPNQRLVIGPIALPRTTRYVVIIADLGGRATPPDGQFAFLVSTITQLAPPSFLQFKTDTGAFVLTQNAADSFYDPPVPGIVSQPTPFSAQATPTPTPASVVVCPSTSFTCAQLFSCAEAQACLAAGNFSLDPNNNSIPCEPSETGGIQLASACFAPLGP